MANAWPNLQRPLPHGLVADDDAARGQHLLDHAQAEREAEVQPNGVADDLGRKAVAGIAGGGRRCHPVRLRDLARPRQAANLTVPSEILAGQPQAYRPIFMIDDNGSIVVRDWAVGFALGIGLRPKEWGESILLTKHRQLLIPILVYCEGELDLLPEITAAEKRRRQATAHQQIAQAVAAARDICNPLYVAACSARTISRRAARKAVSLMRPFGQRTCAVDMAPLLRAPLFMLDGIQGRGMPLIPRTR